MTVYKFALRVTLLFCCLGSLSMARAEEDAGTGAPGERGGALVHSRQQDKKKKKKSKAKTPPSATAHKENVEPQKQTEGQPEYDVKDATIVPTVTPNVTSKAEEKKRPWTLDLYYEDYYTMSDADHNNGVMFTDGYIGTTYTLDKNWRIYLRQNYIMNVDRSRTQEFEYNGMLSDTEFGFYRDNIFTWAGGGSFNAYTRFYVSTGYHQWAVNAVEHSGQLFRFRPEFITSQPLGKYFEVGHIIDPRAMVNQRNGQIVDDGTGKLVGQANSTYKFEQFFYATGHTKKLSGTAILGTYDFWYYAFNGPDGKPLPTHHSYMYSDLSATWQIVDQVAATIGVENDMQTDSTQPYRSSWLRERETYYYLNLFVRI